MRVVVWFIFSMMLQCLKADPLLCKSIVYLHSTIIWLLSNTDWDEETKYILGTFDNYMACFIFSRGCSVAKFKQMLFSHHFLLHRIRDQDFRDVFRLHGPLCSRIVQGNVNDLLTNTAHHILKQSCKFQETTYHFLVRRTLTGYWTVMLLVTFQNNLFSAFWIVPVLRSDLQCIM